MLFSSLYLLLPVALAAVPGKRATTTDACYAANLTFKASSSIPGQLAQDCLLSLPYESSKAKTFISGLRKYVQFQSTLDALKDPPDTYLSPKVDILGGLDEIAKTDYASQYQFDNAITDVVRSANDGHLRISLCSLSIFRFLRSDMTLVSISKDGRTAPAIYATRDAKYAFNSTSKVTVSPVATINGEFALDYLEKVASSQGQQDPDARWNRLFQSNAFGAVSSSFLSSGAFRYDGNRWPGTNSTTITFANGTMIDVPTIASLRVGSLDGSAASNYNSYCLQNSGTNKRSLPNMEAGAIPSDPLDKRAVSGPSGYPTPFLRTSDNKISGYYVNEDTAAMFIPTFSLDSRNESFLFSNTASDIIQRAQASGRSKIVIDVSGNGGGSIPAGFDLFKLFFPSKFPYSGTRFRRHDAVDMLAAIFASLNRTEALSVLQIGYKAQLRPSQDQGIASLEEFLNGETQLGVNVSSLYANFDYAWQSDNGRPIHGFGAVSQNTTQPYKAEDIIIVGDGYCASTCTAFVNLMTNVGGVRTVVFGGRPRYGPMQIMGGVRAAQSYSFTDLNLTMAYAEELVMNARAKGEDILTWPQIRLAQETMPPFLSELPFQFTDGNINFRNAYQEGNEHLPLQFDYQAADCRLFFTYANLAKPETMWQDASDAVWGDKGCVARSTGAKGSRS